MGKYVWHWSVYVSQTFSLVCAVFWVDCLLESGKAVNIYSVNALRATGDVNYPFIVGIIVQWLVGVLLGYTFGIWMGWGLVGMWFAFALDEDIRGVIFIRRWNSRKWAKKGFVQ